MGDTHMIDTRSKDKIGVVLLIVVAAIWGSGFIASQMALDANITPQLLMMVRFVIATAVIGVIFFKRIKTNIKKADIPAGSLIGLFLFLAFYIQVVALQYTTPSNNAFLTAANVVMVPFIWWVITKKPPSGKIFVSSIVCLLGIGILSLKMGQGISFGMGDLLTLLGAFFFACQIVSTGKLAEKMDTTVIVFLQFVVAALLSTLLFFATDRNIAPLLTIEGALPLIYLGVCSTCLCYFLQTLAQKNVDSSKAAIILGTEALFGTLFSVTMGYDMITINMVVGGSIIMVALIMTEWSPRGKKINTNL